MSQSTTDLQKLFIEWLLLPESKRGEITSEAEWARRMDLNPRTLRRWKTTARFNDMLERAKAGLPLATEAAPVVEQPVVEVDPSVPTDEADYRVVKSVLVAGAKQGNPKYLEMYLKTYGKPFVEEEVASRATDLAGMDLDDLVAKALATVSTEAIVAHLVADGWKVERNDGDGTARPG